MTERSRSGKTAWDKEKTRELFRRYKETGDPDAREQLVMSHMNLVRFLANKFKNRGEPLDDLMQVGYLGLLKAIDRFDPRARTRVHDVCDTHYPGRDQTPFPRQGLERARTASSAGALGQGQPGY